MILIESKEPIKRQCGDIDDNRHKRACKTESDHIGRPWPFRSECLASNWIWLSINRHAGAYFYLRDACSFVFNHTLLRLYPGFPPVSPGLSHSKVHSFHVVTCRTNPNTLLSYGSEPVVLHRRWPDHLSAGNTHTSVTSDATFERQEYCMPIARIV